MGVTLYGPSVGWCPGPRAGESEAQATQRNLAAYPGTTVIRKFFSGGLGGWSDGALAHVPSGCEVVVSIGSNHLSAPLRAFAEAIPDHIPRLTFVGRHEPEKKVSPEGFADEAEYYDSQLPRTHPLRRDGRVLLGPMMTLQRARIFAPGDWARFVSDRVLRVSDVLGWDVYPSDPSDYTADAPHWHRYESPVSLLELARSKSTQLGLPYAIGEFNHEAVPGDPTGAGAADLFEGVYRTARNDGCLFVAQFAKGGGDWTDLDDVQNRTVYNRWRGVIREAKAARDAFASGVKVGELGSNVATVLAQRAVLDKVTMYVQSIRP